ncbi:MAG TPA: hemerythrin domain-containing protein, partial [Gemmatimonadales bacterium]|nr:hemerythrin domain-containing protein [Gemmatimonadales bacterium]
LNVIRYFDTAGAYHHLDEEEDLFPALQHHTPSEELNATFSLIFRLRTEHKKLDGMWAEMRSRLGEVVAGRSGGLTSAMAAAFREAYERHIAAEESELLPLARRVLPGKILELLGERMARRRGVELHP